MKEQDYSLRQLRGQYEQIKAPSAHQERLNQLMKEQKKHRRTQAYLRRACGTAAAVAITLTAFTNISPNAAAFLGDIPVIGSFTRLVTFRDYRDDSGNTSASIQTPHVIGMEDKTLEQALNDKFDQYADQLIAQYVKDTQDLAGSQGYESIDCSYEVATDSDRILAIRISTTVARGSAEQRENYYVVDKRAGKLLALSDLFAPDADYVGVISQNIIGQMQEQMKEDDGKFYFIGPDEPEPFTAIEDNQQFYVTESGQLVISFDEYQVAPGYMGAVSFTIPTEAISGMVAEDGPLS